MLYYKFCVNIVVIFTLIRIQDCFYFIATKQNWVNARQQCIHLGMNLTGSIGFYSNHTARYDPNHSIQVDSIASFPAWIGGYIKTTLWISQDDCYSIKHKDLPKIDKSFLLSLNGPKECSLKCGIGTFALQANACFCLTPSDKRSLVKKVPIVNCVEPCSGDSNYYCGALHSSGNNRYLSLYKAIYLKETFPDEYNCLAMSLNTPSVQGKRCNEHLNCFCRKVDGNIVYQSLTSSWERCNRNCREYGAQVVTIDISYMASLPLQYNIWYWNGYFRFVFQIWDKPLVNDFGELKGCMTLEKNGSGFMFGTELCDSSLNAICDTSYKLYKNSSTTIEITINNTTTKESTDTRLSDERHSAEYLIGIIVGAVVAIVAILIAFVFICKRRRGYLFSKTNVLCSCCQNKNKPRPVAPSVRDLHPNMDDPGRHIYSYIDPADIKSVPVQNIYEDPDTHFHSKPNVQVDNAGYLEPRFQRESPIRTHSDEQSGNTDEIHPEARTLLNDIDNTEGDIILNSDSNAIMYHVGRPRLHYSENGNHDSNVEETMQPDSAMYQTNSTLSTNSKNRNIDICSKETMLSDND